MTVTAYVVDTSYLFDLFNVGRNANDRAVVAIRERFEAAIQIKSRIFVPLPCIFELGNHIAHIKNRKYSRVLAESLCNTVKSSMEDSVPWIIKPAKKIEKVLPKLFSVFLNEFVSQGIGMTDSFVIQEAKYLKKKFAKTHIVHIWTREPSMKSYEPDKEPNPFIR